MIKAAESITVVCADAGQGRRNILLGDSGRPGVFFIHKTTTTTITATRH